jgi:hypothetical protein
MLQLMLAAGATHIQCYRTRGNVEYGSSPCSDLTMAHKRALVNWTRRYSSASRLGELVANKPAILV